MSEPGVSARKKLDEGRAALLARHREGLGGVETVRAISKITDEVLAGMFATLCADSPESAPLSVVATGGYGRSELSPRSDIDLLALLPTDARRERAEAIATRLHRSLWDLGLEVGFAARTIDQCVALAREDHTIRTALLDARFVAGDQELMNGLERAVRTQIEPRNVEEFIADKVEEVRERRKRYGGSVWLLEPHLKQGTGGLRDLQAALWIARARHGIAGLREAGERELLPRRDVEAAAKARDTLLRLRNELHWLTGRRDDRLTFENQRKAAAALGYQDQQGELAVEQLMRGAYIGLQEIARASDALIDRCAHEDAPRAALSRKGKRKPIDDSFALLEGRIVVNDREVFSRRPAEMVRMYLVAEICGAKVSSSARDMAVRELDRLGETLESDREAHRELWTLLVHDGGQGEALIPLHELGVLAAMFPEMRRLRGRAQHSVYHVYTVDTHTVFALARLMRLRAGAMAETEPELTRIARDIERPLVLMLGLLFHDLGKGLGDDHSRRGAELVRSYAGRIGLEPEDAEDVAWLVLVHLRMAHLSQRRDLEDAQLIDEFAREVRTVERLEMLYLLTYADMASVSAENYTAWKAGLLRALYEKTRAALLSEGLDAPAHAQDVDHRRARLKERLAGHPQVEAFVEALPERYLSLHASRHDVVARDLDLWRIARKSGFAGELRADELTLCAPDRPGLLALFAAALAANGIDILAAEVTSLGHDVALDRFTVREAGGSYPSEQRWQSARADLMKLLAGDEEPGKLVGRRLRRASWAVGKAPPVKTRVRVEGGILEVNTEDRPGLLHAIAEALHGASVSIAVARIATEGNKAVDSFYLEDLTGGRPPVRLQDPIRTSEVILAVESAIASLAARG